MSWLLKWTVLRSWGRGESVFEVPLLFFYRWSLPDFLKKGEVCSWWCVPPLLPATSLADLPQKLSVLPHLSVRRNQQLTKMAPFSWERDWGYKPVFCLKVPNSVAVGWRRAQRASLSLITWRVFVSALSPQRYMNFRTAELALKRTEQAGLCHQHSVSNTFYKFLSINTSWFFLYSVFWTSWIWAIIFSLMSPLFWPKRQRFLLWSKVSTTCRYLFQRSRDQPAQVMWPASHLAQNYLENQKQNLLKMSKNDECSLSVPLSLVFSTPDTGLPASQKKPNLWTCWFFSCFEFKV